MRIRGIGVAGMDPQEGPAQRTQRVVAALTRAMRSGDDEELAPFTLEELQEAEQRLGPRDGAAGWRRRLRRRIHELAEERRRRRQQRWLEWLVAFLLGCLAVLAVEHGLELAALVNRLLES